MKPFHLDGRSLRLLREKSRRVARQHREVCGALICDEEKTLTVRFLKNLTDEPSKWLIERSWLTDIRRELRGGKRRIVGTFHSHTRGYACPSDGDLDRLPDDYLMLIYDVIEDSVGLWRRHRVGKSYQLFCYAATKARDDAGLADARRQFKLVLERHRSDARRKNPDLDLKRMLKRAAVENR